ncbi:MAG: ParB/RepB/Spo0J family partition protein [Treponema sp.]|nr:ParB/RepB/Spo0J family partition protein [Treponema sp.]
MAKHRGLGKGFDALLDGTTTGFEFDSSQGTNPAPSVRNDLPAGITADNDGTLWVNPALLKPNPRQPRQFFDEEKLSELTESVKREGVLSPIIIEDAEDGSFYIIAGERRTRAARAAGLEKVPVQLRKYSDARKLEVALIENIQRTDLNPVEEAEAYMQLMQLEGITQEEVAEKVGKSRPAVANTIRLLKLSDDMRKSLASGELSSGHARALLSVSDPTARQSLFKKIMSQGLSVRQAEKEAGELNGTTTAKSPKTEKARDPNYADLEQKFIEALGTKVQMRGNWDKGQLVIDYFSQDDLDRIFNKIVGSRGN